MEDTFIQSYEVLSHFDQERAIHFMLALELNSKSRSTQSIPSRRLSDAQRNRFRVQLVRSIWEPDLRKDLVDRIVDAFDAGYFDVVTLRATIRRAKNRKLDYDRSNGVKGKDAIWKTLASWVKGIYESQGRKWTPTTSAVEPRPAAQPRPKIAGISDDDPAAKAWEECQMSSRQGSGW